jgi:PST family polysaccharide transporter
MSLVVAPLGVGLGAVAPTLVHAFFDKRWAEMGMILAVLSCMTIFQPAAWPTNAYLETEKKPRLILIASVARTIALLGGVAILGKLGGPIWACVGVGIGFTVYTVSLVFLTALVTPLPVGRYFIACLRPLVACGPMFFAVFAVRRFFTPMHIPAGIQLALEVLVGAVVYIVGTFVFARTNVQELIGLVRDRKGGPASSSAR